MQINPGDLNDGLIWLSGVMIALGIIWRMVGRPALRSVRRMHEMVEWIAEQMRPNGGGSVRDSLDRMEARMTDLTARLVRVEDNQHPEEQP